MGGAVSKPRYRWWGYAKGMIRDYPALKERYEELHSISAVANYSGMPRGGGDRSLENIAIRELPTTEQREYEAVRLAIEVTKRYRNGADRLKVVDLVLWKGSYTLAGAAMAVPCSLRSAAQWHGDFIRTVAKNYGLMDE